MNDPINNNMKKLPLIELFYDEKHITTVGAHIMDGIYQLPSTFKSMHPELFDELELPKKIKVKVNGKVIENWKIASTEFDSVLLHTNTETVVNSL